MAIGVKLDDLLHDRRMTLTELADRVGMTLANLSILKTGKARAILYGRYNVSCDDIRAMAQPVLRHRILLNFQAESEKVDSDQVIEKLVETVTEPKSGLS